MPRLLDDEEITRQLGDLPGWAREGAEITVAYKAPDFMTGIAIVDEAADAAEQMGHHPDIDIRWTTSRWRLSTHSEGGLTQLDIELAHRIQQAAQRRGATVVEGS